MPVFSPTRVILCICLLVLGGACTKTVSNQQTNNENDKSSESTTQIKLYPVRFSVGDVQVYNQRSTGREMPARFYLSYMYYAAYDSAGRQVRKIEQDYTMGNAFGVIKDSLPSGKYTVLMIGARGALFFHADSLLSNMSFYAAVGDIFYKKFTINVGEHDSAVSTVKLDRISGRLKIDLTDSLPAEVAKLDVIINGTMPSSYFPAADTVGDLSNLAGGLYNNETDLLGSDIKHNVVIHGVDKDGMTLYQKVIKNVAIKPNQLTILRGSLTSPDSTDASGGTSFTFDPDYAGEPIIKNF